MTALDNSVVFCSSEIEDGDAHRHSNLPVVIVGGAGGALAPGGHKRYSGAAMADVFIALLNGLGRPTTTFGDDGTRALPGVLA